MREPVGEPVKALEGEWLGDTIWAVLGNSGGQCRGRAGERAEAG